jgi:mono/diheme cytochrome c family protein
MYRIFVFVISSVFWISTFFQNASFEIQDPQPSKELKDSMLKGLEIYSSFCISCHMQNGEGISGAFPPLAKSDYLMKDRERSIHQVIFGVEGEIEVNGVTYYGMMQPTGLNDEQVANVLNYVRNSWGNKDLKVITKDEVAKVRAKADEGK